MANIPRAYSLVNNPIASLLAYEIAQIPSQPKVPQVVLLLNDQKKLSRFLENDSKLTIQKGNDSDYHHTQFMASHLPPVYSSGQVASIANAIFSGPHTKGLVQSIRKYCACFHGFSNILLVDPPAGAIEHLYRKVWRTVHSRPNLFVGVTTQRERRIATSVDEFRIDVKQGTLSLSISPVPKDFKHYTFNTTFDDELKRRHDVDLFKLLDAASNNESGVVPLDIRYHSYGELLLMRLERLIVESCTEPLAAIYGCRYIGELLFSSQADDMIRKMIKEQMRILWLTHPFLANIQNSGIALDCERLYSVIKKELNSGIDRKSVMRLKVDQLEATNVNELTGYFVRLAAYRKIDCKWNEAVTNLVKGKVALTRHRALSHKYL
ncbi:hypothetical protein HG536_0C00500 [Torulaspora globosa]|uniref:Ketopantoate reductase C-terminal domain-containing protein n=1 Tax=Torulaspora globosa TaxID=48254 RepID=A0A7G3ZEE7_9SACH|nr:uncharacterized protein HG536_0C00500 [Torulaspora globosa]QLL31883.1 hypothetical protein HG536_0C00500 [Torulaspora globosa]